MNTKYGGNIGRVIFHLSNGLRGAALGNIRTITQLIAIWGYMGNPHGAGHGEIKCILGTPFPFSGCIYLSSMFYCSTFCGIVFVPDNLTSSSHLLLPKALLYIIMVSLVEIPDNLTWTR